MTDQKKWYAIRVHPRALRPRAKTKIEIRRKTKTENNPKPFLIENLLNNQGFDFFIPTKTVWRRISKYSKDKQQIKLPIMPGWIFVAWTNQENHWAKLFSTNIIIGIAGIKNQPIKIPNSKIKYLKSQYTNVKAPKQEQFMKSNLEYNIGETVTIDEGPFTGQNVNVIDINGPTATILMDILGAKQTIKNTMILSTMTLDNI